MIMQNLSVERFFDLNETISYKIFDNIKYPWDAINKISEFLNIFLSNFSDDNFYQREGNIFISKDAYVSPSSCIKGPCLIDSKAEIRHGAFIRGNVIIGKNTVVGNSSELKNCVLFNSVQVPHFNYVGDSIMGYKSHIGAGVILSNLKSNRSFITVNINGEKIDTHLKKFGAIIGDFVEIGCNSVLNPGTVIGKNSIIYPLSSVRGYIPENKIFKSRDNIVDKI